MEAEEGMDATEILMREEKEEGEGEDGRLRSVSEPMKKKDEVSYTVRFNIIQSFSYHLSPLVLHLFLIPIGVLE